MEISKLYKKIKQYKERDRSKLYLNPFHEWNIILLFGVILSVMFAFFYYKAFNDVYVNRFKEENINSSEKDPHKTKDLKTKLSETLQYYEEREKEHNALLEKQPVLENVVNIKTPVSSVKPSVKKASQTEPKQVEQSKKSEEVKDENEGTSTKPEI